MQTVDYVKVPIDQLRKNPWNSNQVSPDNENKIKKSIERNGLFKPVIVRTVNGVSGYEIIGGEHRWEQAVELGHKEITVANLGPISVSQAKEIGVIDNARYGIDDTLSLAEILKDIEAENLQEFLPYGETDLNAIFSSTDIDLDDLEIDEDFDNPDEDKAPEVQELKAAKTHVIMRFKVPIGDAETITQSIASTQRDQGFSDSDDLTNAGDALVHLLTSQGEN